MPFKNKEDRLSYHQRYFREHREEMRAYEERNRDTTNSQRRERYRRKRAGLPNLRTTHGKSNTAEYLLLQGAKKRAAQKGLCLALSVEDIPAIPLRCPVLGIEIRRSNGRMSDNSPSLDRMKPERGYVVGNIRVVSWRANRLRSDATAQELFLIATDAAKLEHDCG